MDAKMLSPLWLFETVDRKGSKMELNKEIWKNKDIDEFNKFLEIEKRLDKIEFAKKTINTNMEVLGIPIPDLRKISKEISKGNYLSFFGFEKQQIL